MISQYLFTYNVWSTGDEEKLEGILPPTAPTLISPAPEYELNPIVTGAYIEASPTGKVVVEPVICNCRFPFIYLDDDVPDKDPDELIITLYVPVLIIPADMVSVPFTVTSPDRVTPALLLTVRLLKVVPLITWLADPLNVIEFPEADAVSVPVDSRGPAMLRLLLVPFVQEDPENVPVIPPEAEELTVPLLVMVTVPLMAIVPAIVWLQAASMV